MALLFTFKFQIVIVMFEYLAPRYLNSFPKEIVESEVYQFVGVVIC